jgi:hypothetical protein
MSAKAKREAQAAGIKYGCHVDLEDGSVPDNCVKDEEGDGGCIHAPQHRKREGSRWWQPIKETKP